MLNVTSLTNLAKPATRFLNTNAPAILTAFGAVGVVSTSVLAVQATMKANADIYEENADRSRKALDANDPDIYLSKSEVVKLVWPHYVPAVASGTISIAAIVMSNRISSKRAAVLAAAYALNESKLEEYQEKIKEKFGVKKEAEARTEIHQDRINREYDPNTVIFSPMAGKVLIREDYTGRFFWANKQEIDAAVNEINHQILVDGYTRMSEFYDLIGLDHVSLSDHFGWNSNERLELQWDVGTTPDESTPVHTFDYVNPPIMNPGAGSSFLR